jgi:short-subunit dehydrogenase
MGLRERYGDWALVTGASSGIGRALARAIAADGMGVVLVADDPAGLDEAAEEVQAEGVDARICCVDLGGADFLGDVRAATEGIEIALLANNASFGGVGAFLAHPLETYDAMIAVNARAYVALTHTYLPRMLDAGRGALIFVSSLNANAPIANSSVYTATKAFDLYFGGALWWELRDTDIDVLVLQPGPTRTGFQEKAQTHVASWAMEPEEVAAEGLAALGTAPFHVAGERNREIAALGAAMTLEERIAAASQMLEEALILGVEPSP